MFWEPSFLVELVLILKHKVNWLGISLTSSCNLNCPYCYADAQKNGVFLDEKKFEAFLDYFVPYAAPNILIVLTGGEPTLHPKLLSFIKYAKSVFINPYIVITTNGVAPKKLIDQLIDEGVSLQISFEGLPEINDQERPSFKGPLTDKVIETIKHSFMRSPDKTILRVNYSPSKFGKEKEIARYFRSLGVTNVSLGVIQPSGRGKTYKGLDVLESTKRLKNFIDALKDEGLHMPRKFEDDAEWPSCGAGEKTFFMTTDAVITGCQYPVLESRIDKSHQHFILGRVNKTVDFDENALKTFRKFAKEVPEKCGKCEILSKCGGCLWYRNFDGKNSTYPETFCASRFADANTLTNFH